MNFLIGWLTGERIGSAAGEFNDLTNNSLWGLFWWSVLAVAAHYGFASNFGPAYALPGQIGTMGSVLIYSCYRPIGSPFKSMMIDAVFLILKVIFYLSFFYVVVKVGWALLSGGFKHEGLSAIPFSKVVWISGLMVVAYFLYQLLLVIIIFDHRRRDRVAHHRANEGPFGDTRSDWSDDGRRAGGGGSGHAGSSGPSSEARSTARVPQDWWTVLEVERASSLAECKKAANKLRLKYHPDIVTGDRPLFKQSSEEIIKRINDALEAAKQEKGV